MKGSGILVGEFHVSAQYDVEMLEKRWTYFLLLRRSKWTTVGTLDTGAKVSSPWSVRLKLQPVSRAVLSAPTSMMAESYQGPSPVLVGK